jgi:hypothetical protein
MAVPVVIRGQAKRPFGNKPLVEKVASTPPEALRATFDATFREILTAVDPESQVH